MKRYFSLMILSLIFVLIGFSGCDEYQGSADEAITDETQKRMEESNSEVGMPDTPNWYEKKMSKNLYELRDQSDLVCYAYIWSDYNAKFVYIGECRGYGLPYSVQFSNPYYIAEKGSSYGYAILPQPEPNGLYMPDGLSATWLQLLDEKTGKVAPLYVEPQIAVFQHKLPERIVIGY